MEGRCEEKGQPKSPRKQYDPDDLVNVLRNVNGDICRIVATKTSGPGQQEVATEQVLQQFELFGVNFADVWRTLVGSVEHCPGAPSPQEVAYSFVHEAGAPDPQPYVAPGHAITGKKAYLETRGPLTYTQTFQTLLGPLDITFTAQDFTVDWGDGSNRDRGPFASPGKPYPNGQATHVYTDTSTVNIVVTQRWTASWSVAGEGGQLEITSTGRIDNFQVRQLQAVRKR